MTGKRIGYLVYGLACYVAFLGTSVYAIGFVEGQLVPRTVDAGGPSAPPGTALLVDVLLLGLFAVQHSVMARRSFKRLWTRIIPPPIERSTYVLCACASLILLFAFWRPLPRVLWNVEQPVLRAMVVGLSMLGWETVFLSTFLIDHLELTGLRQVHLADRNVEQPSNRFRTPALYKLVRHPLYLGFIVAFWAAPTMTVGHGVFALAMLGYVLVGIHYEERDLVREYGERYLAYRQQVRGLLPLPRRRSEPPDRRAGDPAARAQDRSMGNHTSSRGRTA
jgi:protein-S-isoprenylcysteine O-methyltransferase Ste14